MNNKIYSKLILLAIVIVSAVYIYVHFDLYEYFEMRDKLMEFINSFGPLSIVVFILIQIVQVLIAPVPGEVSGFIGGYLFGIVFGTIYSTIGLTIGSWLAFILSRTFGLPLVEKFVNPKILARYDHFMEHKGIFVSFLLFLLPGFPKDALCYILGLSHMNIKIFLIISTVGRLFGTLMLSIQGNLVRNDQDMAFIVISVIGGIVFILGYFFGQKWLDNIKKKRRSE